HVFLYCSAPPRDLHSFPTRRSSDLFYAQVSGPVGPYTLGFYNVQNLGPFTETEPNDTIATAHPVSVGLESPASIDGFAGTDTGRSEEHTSELQSRRDLVCRLLLEKK